MTITILWWHIPVILLIVGWLMYVAGQRRVWNSWGWPDSESTGFGIVGGMLVVLGIVLLFGGCYRGLFL